MAVSTISVTKKIGGTKMNKAKKKKDWLVVLFRKANFDEKLERNALYTFKQSYDGIVVVLFNGPEPAITMLCLKLLSVDAALHPSERSVLMQIDKEGIVN